MTSALVPLAVLAGIRYLPDVLAMLRARREDIPAVMRARSASGIELPRQSRENRADKTATP